MEKNKKQPSPAGGSAPSRPIREEVNMILEIQLERPVKQGEVTINIPYLHTIGTRFIKEIGRTPTGTTIRVGDKDLFIKEDYDSLIMRMAKGHYFYNRDQIVPRSKPGNAETGSKPVMKVVKNKKKKAKGKK